MKLQFRPDKSEIRQALMAKTPQYLYRVRPFTLEKCLKTYTSNVEGYNPVRITRESQLESVQEMIEAAADEDPFVGCISSDIDDLRAKVLAYHICANSKVNYRWHLLLSGFTDELIPTPHLLNKIKLLVIYNVMFDMDNHRLQKLRDLLEYYSDIPRIVVTTSGDPNILFDKLGFTLDHCVWIKSDKRCQIV